MKSVLTLSIIFILVSFKVLACMVPIHGNEYDALVKIKKLDKHQYFLSLPRSVNSSKGKPSVFMLYNKVNNYGSDSTLPEQYVEEVKLLNWFDSIMEYFPIEKDPIIKVQFTSESREGYIRTIKVSWPSNLCSTSASQLIDVAGNAIQGN